MFYFWLNSSYQEPKITVLTKTTEPKIDTPEEKKFTYTRASQAIKTSSSTVDKDNQVFLFPFDPNSISEDSLKLLGLKKWVINNIIKYRSHGGKFKQKSDLQKIYGLEEESYQRIKPYILLKDTMFRHPSPPPIATRTLTLIDINTADSSAWVSLRGIGPVLSRRIIKFRNRLGGFHDISQISEVYGLSDSTYLNIRHQLEIKKANTTTININTADFKKLKKHPYISSKIAKLIIQYRKQHGPYNNIEGIRDIKIISDSLFQKISPYLRVENAKENEL